MKQLYFIHLLSDVCTFLAFLTRNFERQDVDFSIIKPTISTLRKIKEKNAPVTSHAASVTDNLGFEINENTLHAIQVARSNFIDNLTKKIDEK